MAKGSSLNKGRVEPIGFAHMIRDIIVACVNKGQLPIIIFGLVLFAMILKMSESDVGKLIFLVVENLKNGSLVGYLLFFLAITGCYFHSTRLRRQYAGEINRLSDERTKLQAGQLGERVRSSEEQK